MKETVSGSVVVLTTPKINLSGDEVWEDDFGFRKESLNCYCASNTSKTAAFAFHRSGRINKQMAQNLQPH